MLFIFVAKKTAIHYFSQSCFIFKRWAFSFQERRFLHLNLSKYIRNCAKRYQSIFSVTGIVITHSHVLTSLSVYNQSQNTYGSFKRKVQWLISSTFLWLFPNLISQRGAWLHYTQFWGFSKFSLFPQILSFKSFGTRDGTCTFSFRWRETMLNFEKCQLYCRVVEDLNYIHANTLSSRLVYFKHLMRSYIITACSWSWSWLIKTTP